ncbi:MAG: hypothetical protein WBD46_05760 [Acidobacteriaceae bacterium]
MKIDMVGISPRESLGMVHVSFVLSAKREKTWDGGKIEVFVPASDSVAEIQRTALNSVRRLAEEILAFPGNETKSDDPDDPENLAKLAVEVQSRVFGEPPDAT